MQRLPHVYGLFASEEGLSQSQAHIVEIADNEKSLHFESGGEELKGGDQHFPQGVSFKLPSH